MDTKDTAGRLPRRGFQIGCISKFSKYYLCDIINNLTRFCMSTKLNSEDFSEIMKAQFEALKQAVDAKDFYRAELGFVNTWKEIGREVFEELVKEPPQGQKKSQKVSCHIRGSLPLRKLILLLRCAEALKSARCCKRKWFMRDTWRVMKRELRRWKGCAM